MQQSQGPLEPPARKMDVDEDYDDEGDDDAGSKKPAAMVGKGGSPGSVNGSGSVTGRDRERERDRDG